MAFCNLLYREKLEEEEDDLLSAFFRTKGDKVITQNHSNNSVYRTVYRNFLILYENDKRKVLRTPFRHKFKGLRLK